METTSGSGRILTRPVLGRLPSYLNYLKLKQKEGADFIASSAMAEDLKLTSVQIRKDLEQTGVSGRPKKGYRIGELIDVINNILGYSNSKDAVLVGAGKLGIALLSYKGFAEYGLNIVAAFDSDEYLCKIEIGGKKVFHVSQLKHMVKDLNINIGIITVPASSAQIICDALVESGIRAIWNFAPVHLHVPDSVILQNENMAASLALLSNRLAEQFRNKG
jgi:redox-sensing transcriptional repressor